MSKLTRVLLEHTLRILLVGIVVIGAGLLLLTIAVVPMLMPLAVGIILITKGYWAD